MISKAGSGHKVHKACRHIKTTGEANASPSMQNLWRWWSPWVWSWKYAATLLCNCFWMMSVWFGALSRGRIRLSARFLSEEESLREARTCSNWWMRQRFPLSFLSDGNKTTCNVMYPQTNTEDTEKLCLLMYGHNSSSAVVLNPNPLYFSQREIYICMVQGYSCKITSRPGSSRSKKDMELSWRV